MTDDDRTTAEVNRRYWGSEASVAEIAEALGISRRALYSSLQPMNAGAECEDCDAALVYMNRTSRTAGVAQCTECGVEIIVAEVTDADAMQPPGGIDFRDIDGRRAAYIAGGLLTGALVGATATLFITRRR